ncbi:MAG: hypothetical protein WCS45_05820 [Clostridia bacterium]
MNSFEPLHKHKNDSAKNGAVGIKGNTIPIIPAAKNTVAKILNADCLTLFQSIRIRKPFLY